MKDHNLTESQLNLLKSVSLGGSLVTLDKEVASELDKLWSAGLVRLFSHKFHTSLVKVVCTPAGHRVVEDTLWGEAL